MRNYYIILGVSPTESLAGIRAAYRRLARQHHPDVAGTQDTGAFQDIEEAYRVLSDPEGRRRHDRELRQERARARAARRPAPAPRAGPAEPASASRPSPADLIMPEPLHVFGDPASVHPSFEALYERWRRNFTGLGVPKAERVEELAFEVVLSPAEAARGAVVPIGVPVFRPCPACGGTGREWLFPCLACGQQGVVEDEETVGVRVPPLVGHGTVIEVPLHGLGIHNFQLRLHIAISETASGW